jgi:hypothetical protein
MEMAAIRKLIYIGLALGVLANVGLFFFGPQVALFYINAKGGCFPWSPAEVEYYDGMTICPGQSARMTIPLIIEYQPQKPRPRI